MSWRNDAACRGLPAEVFYPERGGGRDRAAEPLRVCGQCRVRSECLAEALDREEMGIWGGMTAVGRRRLRRHLGIVLYRPEVLATVDDLERDVEVKQRARMVAMVRRRQVLRDLLASADEQAS